MHGHHVEHLRREVNWMSAVIIGGIFFFAHIVIYMMYRNFEYLIVQERKEIEAKKMADAKAGLVRRAVPPP